MNHMRGKGMTVKSRLSNPMKRSVNRNAECEDVTPAIRNVEERNLYISLQYGSMNELRLNVAKLFKNINKGQITKPKEKVLKSLEQNLVDHQTLP